MEMAIWLWILVAPAVAIVALERQEELILVRALLGRARP